VPATSTLPDNETINFPVVGGGITSQGTIKITISDLTKLFDSRVEPDNPAVHKKAVEITGIYPGLYTIQEITL